MASMTQDRPLLSIVVPTRERPETLAYCLRTIVDQPDQRIEIIVSDNCSAPRTREVVDAVKDKRLRYIRPEQRLGMTEHWEFALGHAQGDWITFIGDDDGLLPSAAARFFDLVGRYKVEAVTSNVSRFRWPDPPDRDESRLVVHLGHGAEIRDARQALIDILHRGGEFVALPYIYTGGFLHKNVIAKVKDRSGGRFFQSIIPDVYSAVAACSVVDKYLFVREPLAVAGVSPRSNGLQISRTPAGNLLDIPFYTESKMTFLPMLGNGAIKGVPLLIYEAVLRSQNLRDFDLDISLPQQLALAIADATKNTRAEIVEYIGGVARLNGVDFKEVLRLSRGIRREIRLRKLGRQIRDHTPYLRGLQKQIFVGDPELRTICDATRRVEAFV
jgi:glycosyltransferase involved in cell wall biosynthesis